jgi:PIN domain nuclease of toxin-antitoxin system
VRLLLDTVILIYAVESPELLSKRAISSLQNPDNIRELSSISLAEIAIKSSAGKLKLSVGMLRQALEDLNIRVLPYTARHCVRTVCSRSSSQRSLRPANYCSGTIREDFYRDFR